MNKHQPEIQARVNTKLSKKLVGIIAMALMILAGIAGLFGVTIDSEVDEESVEISIDLPEDTSPTEGSGVIVEEPGDASEVSQ